MNEERQQMCLVFDQLTISHLKLAEQVKQGKGNVTKDTLKVLEGRLREQSLRLVAAADAYGRIAETLPPKQVTVLHQRDGMIVEQFKADVSTDGRVTTVMFPHNITCLSGDTVSYDTVICE